MSSWRAVSLLACFGLALPMASAQPGSTTGTALPDLPSARALLEVFNTLRSSYNLTSPDLDEDALWQGAINGMVAALPDRYSFYQDPRATERLQGLESATSYSGIGVQLIELDPTARLGSQVDKAFPNGPAERAGLLPGDVILEVDGHDVRKLPLGDVQALILGETGTVAGLLIARPGDVGPLTLEVERGRVSFDTSLDVDSRLLDDQVGYLRIAAFELPRLNFLVREQLDALETAGATALVLDLRDNMGGSLELASDVLSEFLNAKPIWSYSSRGVQRASEVSRRRPANDWPMVVLVNSRTYSAGEVVAAALQQNGRAVVVGERTFGKGFSLRAADLTDGGVLWYVSAQLLTPDGTSLEGTGVVPDVYAPDARRPATLVANGTGAVAGQVIELMVDGVPVARTVAGESGFELVGVAGGGTFASQAGALGVPSADGALAVAIATVVRLRGE